MRLATINPHSQKEHTEIPKIPKFGVNQAIVLTEKQTFKKEKKITKKCMEMRTNLDKKSGCVRISIHLFVIFSRF